MSGPHDERHLPILRELVSESDRAREAFDASDLAACGQCREELEDMLALVATLDAVGDDERSSIRDAAQSADPVREARLRAALRSRIQGAREEARSPERAGRRNRLAAAAAVILIGIAGAWLWTRDAAGDRDPWLGDRAGGLEPVGEVTDFARFHWKVPLPESGWFVVRVYDADAPRPSEQITESIPLRAQEWLPSPVETERWGERIRWRLELYDRSSNIPREAWDAEAWLSSPR